MWRMWPAIALGVGFGVLVVPGLAYAQQKTFHLDRLEIPGAPEDGIALFRPETSQQNIVYGQLALGYSLRPLRVRNITTDNAVVARTNRSSVIQDQLTVYGSAGLQILDRVTFGLTFPFAPVQTGENPNYGTGGIQGVGQARTTFISTGGPTASDLRIDFRGTILRSEDRKSAFGAQVSIFAPTGSRWNLGGDAGTGAMVMVTGEHTIRWVTLVANTGIVFRPRREINDPVGGSGLGIGNEWRWAVGAFVPLKQGKYRVGATIFGQTGIENDHVIGNTVFTKQNTPIEWQAEGRMRFGTANQFWVGLGAGTRILNGYGAPDFRAVALVGAEVPILDAGPPVRESRTQERARWRHEHVSDRDHDGIPDDIDACPDEPEDHQDPDPNDGCPLPPDRDGDGIPDQYDLCPDQPEDKDGIDDGDGCPEDDADNDGIPDAVDACPKEPGPKNPDPKKNGCPTLIKVEGSVVRVLQQVHFKTGSTTILPDSFPMLQEIANLLKANKGIKRMSIEGHTDNRGGADMNKKLSQGRADSVMSWLVQHGIDADRLEAHGYGLERPIEDNATEKGRAKNRRVDFKIVSEENSNQIRR
ncbi:MAG: OmpA family protein [Polyangiaceae bacterium]|nr:OmpA family protein [Polyangiaceae bacterium]